MKWFSLIYQGDIHPSTDEKVIAAEDFSKLVTAQEIIEKATEDGEQFLKNTEEKCKQLRQEADEKGFQEGLEQFNAHIFHMSEQLKVLRLELQQMVLPFAIRASKRIVAKELELFPDTIVDIVTQVIAPIADSHRVTIFVNKEDKAYLEEHKPELKEILQQAEILTIQERGDLSRGDCIIQTEKGIINATIENQWRALEQAFEKYKQRP